MESWRKVFRDGFLPSLNRRQLEALAEGLKLDDPRILQGATTTPPPLMVVQEWPCEAACPLGYTALACGQGDSVPTVGEVEEHFARLCFDADERLGEPAACRWFLNFVDDTPRREMRQELLCEVELALASSTSPQDAGTATVAAPAGTLVQSPSKTADEPCEWWA